jgi:hypothetical protein
VALQAGTSRWSFFFLFFSRTREDEEDEKEGALFFFFFFSQVDGIVPQSVIARRSSGLRRKSRKPVL